MNHACMHACMRMIDGDVNIFSKGCCVSLSADYCGIVRLRSQLARLEVGTDRTRSVRPDKNQNGG